MGKAHFKLVCNILVDEKGANGNPIIMKGGNRHPIYITMYNSTKYEKYVSTPSLVYSIDQAIET